MGQGMENIENESDSEYFDAVDAVEWVKEKDRQFRRMKHMLDSDKKRLEEEKLAFKAEKEKERRRLEKEKFDFQEEKERERRKLEDEKEKFKAEKERFEKLMLDNDNNKGQSSDVTDGWLTKEVQSIKRKVRKWEHEEEKHLRHVKKLKEARAEREKNMREIRDRVRIEEEERERVRDKLRKERNKDFHPSKK